ncbi:MAG: hypothetical protein ING19_16780 [Azospirillum sp.]|nr:hypothetical protein [Azospirillum sp.]
MTDTLASQTPMPAAPTAETARVIARFTPQAWIRDYAVEVDREGPDTWDATAYLLSSFENAKIRCMHDNNYASDDLHLDPNAPAWIRDWHGPFEVEVQESMLAFFSAHAGRAIEHPRDIDDETIAKARAAAIAQGILVPAEAANAENREASKVEPSPTAPAEGYVPGMTRGFRP